MSVITVENLRYRYPHAKELALDGLDFSVEKGEFIGIIGENGAGKSTLSQALMGLVPQFYKGAYGGTVMVDGIEAGRTPVAQLCGHVGLVFQNPFNQLSGAKDNVYEEVAFGMQNLGVPAEEMKNRVEEALKLLDIWQYRDRNPFDLSGGQMQRVAIASVLVMRPDVMILDEPTSQLDPEGSDEVFKAVETLTGSGITILMIEQKIEKLAAYCDRILLLHKGKQIAFDTPQKVFSMSDLNDYGIQAPAFTRICKAEGVTLADGTYPVTVEEGAGVLREKRLEASACADGGERAQRAAGAELAQAGGPTESAGSSDEQFCIENLDFSYLADVPVLKNLNMKLDKRPTAIIGQNGAGKTTLVKLLMRFYDVDAGAIRLGGTDIREFSRTDVRNQFGMVLQDTWLFNGTVRDNIAYGKLDATDAEVEAAARAAYVHHFVTTLPHGYDTVINEDASNISAGQRQLLTIARAILADRRMLILDEATSSVDTRTEERIQKAMDNLMEGRTSFVIAHRLSTIKNADLICVLQHGDIVEQGTHEELLSLGGVYAELYNSQFEEDGVEDE